MTSKVHCDECQKILEYRAPSLYVHLKVEFRGGVNGTLPRQVYDVNDFCNADCFIKHLDKNRNSLYTRAKQLQYDAEKDGLLT
jgi:hypothetical protein